MKWGCRCIRLCFVALLVACSSGPEEGGAALGQCDGCEGDDAFVEGSGLDAYGLNGLDSLWGSKDGVANPHVLEPDGGTVKRDLPSYPLDDLLRLNHVQMKGTHNSYHIAPSEWSLEEWSYTHATLFEQLENQGVRQIELDVHYEGDEGFAVFHLPVVDAATTCATFKECLGEVRLWSNANPGHHPIFILVEPKDVMDVQKINGHYKELEDEILSVFPMESVITPDFVRGEYSTLREGLESQGWPTLGAVRGMVIFVMLDEGRHRNAYLELYPDLKGALIFARGGYGESYGAVLEYGSNDEMTKAVQEGYLLRGNADDLGKSDADNEVMAAAALSKGAHFISTDFSDNSIEGFSFSIPGGTPSRCNPVTAPPECSPEAVENLLP